MLSSLTTTRSPVDDEAVDARHPFALGDAERLHCRALHVFQDVLRQLRRDQQLHAAFVVLRLEVVPLVPERDDLARDRGYRLAVAENADLDFDAVENSSTSTLSSWRKRERDRVVELGFVVRLADPDGRAEPRGLDEARIAERVLGLVALAKRDVLRGPARRCRAAPS